VVHDLFDSLLYRPQDVGVAALLVICALMLTPIERGGAFRNGKGAHWVPLEGVFVSARFQREIIWSPRGTVQGVARATAVLELLQYSVSCTVATLAEQKVIKVCHIEVGNLSCTFGTGCQR